MQAIHTKFIPCTNTRGARIKATCSRGSIVLPYPEGVGEPAHVKVADALVEKFIAEDKEKYGTPPEDNPWSRPRVCGSLPDESCAHVFVGGAK